MSDMNTRIVADNIKVLREQQGLTKREMAEKLNISPSALANYENGVVEPGLKTLLKIKEQFHISLDILCSGKIFLGNMGDFIAYQYAIEESQQLQPEYTFTKTNQGDPCVQIEYREERGKNAGIVELLKNMIMDREDYTSYAIGFDMYEKNKQSSIRDAQTVLLAPEEISDCSREERRKKHVEYMRNHRYM